MGGQGEGERLLRKIGEDMFEMKGDTRKKGDHAAQLGSALPNYRINTCNYKGGTFQIRETIRVWAQETPSPANITLLHTRE